MTVLDFNRPREDILRDVRVATLVNALFMIESGKEIREALERVPSRNLQIMMEICHDILGKETGKCPLENPL